MESMQKNSFLMENISGTMEINALFNRCITIYKKPD